MESYEERKAHFFLPRILRWLLVRHLNDIYSFLMYHLICKSCQYWDPSILECYWFSECNWCPKWISKYQNHSCTAHKGPFKREDIGNKRIPEER